MQQQRPSFLFTAVTGLYWMFLSVWLGGLITTVVTASIMFPGMSELKPTLDAFPDYTGEHGPLAAGVIMAQLFFFGDVVAVICVSGMGFITLLHFTVFGLSPTVRANALRSIILIVLIIAVAYQIFILGPRMNTNLADYHQAAKAGIMKEANLAKAAFDEDHPRASDLMSGHILALVVLVFASASGLSGAGAASPMRRTQSDDHSDGSAPATSRLQEPALATRR